jgi:CO/xanthine dehydrogenase FAD-binding subunit
MDASTAAELGRLARESVPAASDAHASAEYRQHVVGSLTTRLLQEVAS